MTKNKVTINTPTTELGTAFNSIHTDLDFPGYPVIDDTKSLQSCPTLCDPMDCSPSGFSDHGFLQARIREQVAIFFSDERADNGKRNIQKGSHSHSMEKLKALKTSKN